MAAPVSDGDGLVLSEADGVGVLLALVVVGAGVLDVVGGLSGALEQAARSMSAATVAATAALRERRPSRIPRGYARDEGESPRRAPGARDRGIGVTIVVMVVLIALGLSLGILLIVVMVAMTRYMLANPDDPLVPGDGSWSGSMGESTTPPGPAEAAQPRPEPVPVAPAARPMNGADVPLDDMPAEVIAELAERLRRDA